MQVTNALETIVPKTVERLVAEHDHIRDCDKCKSDVLALTLTHLHPEYSSSEMGAIIKRIDIEKAKGKARIAVAVTAAIEVVKESPHHKS